MFFWGGEVERTMITTFISTQVGLKQIFSLKFWTGSLWRVAENMRTCKRWQPKRACAKEKKERGNELND